MDLRGVVDSYLDFCCLVRRLAPGTVDLYAFHLDRFERFSRRRPLDPRAVERFLAARSRAEDADATIRSAYGALRGCFRWAAGRRLIQDPMRDMRPPVCRDRPRLVSDEKATERLLDAIERSGKPSAARDHAALAVCYWAGLRVSEALGLSLEDLDLEVQVLHVIGKGGKRREVPVHPKLAKILRRYLKERPGAGTWLFPSVPHQQRPGGKLDGSRLRYLIRKIYAPAAGLGRVTPHALRRGAATELHRRKVPIELIQRILGHASVLTTRIYIGDTSAELREAMYRL